MVVNRGGASSDGFEVSVVAVVGAATSEFPAADFKMAKIAMPTTTATMLAATAGTTRSVLGLRVGPPCATNGVGAEGVSNRILGPEVSWGRGALCCCVGLAMQR